jgi:MFS family permease
MLSKKLSFIFIIIAGEAIFMLPFMIPRLYRPLILDAWNLNNTQIGTAFSVYGLSAMISYLIGGQFADRYHPRVLMSLSLIITALATSFLIISPSYIVLISTYFFYGISTILLMWGALIKVTHTSGADKDRSSAMGILDAGRGLSAALISSLLLFITSTMYQSLDTQSLKVEALNTIYITVILFIIVMACIIWFSLKNFKIQDTLNNNWTIKEAKVILKNPSVWLLGIVILSAYCGYKSIDNYSVYLVDVHGQGIVQSSIFTTIIFWLRPISAFLAGILADKLHAKIKSGRFIILTILLILSAAMQIIMAINIISIFNIIMMTIIISSALAYALRAIYFSIFGDLNIKETLIGTTVGIVSLVGFLPDFFFGIITGHFIDTYPGHTGYTYCFYFTGVILFIGSLASIIIYRVENKTLLK